MIISSYESTQKLSKIIELFIFNNQPPKEYSMINFALTEKLGRKNSEFQIGFEPTTLRDLIGCSTTELLETLSDALPLSYWRLYCEQG